jgi:hypothetical protein
VKLLVDRTTPFDPGTFIRREWSVWRGPAKGDGLSGQAEQDARSLEISKIDWADVTFVSCLKQGESSVLGEEHLRRLRFGPARGIILDARVGQALYEDYQRDKSVSVLEWLRIYRGIASFTIKGTTLRCPAGGRYCMYFSYDSDESMWDWGGCWHGCRQGIDAAAPVIP